MKSCRTRNSSGVLWTRRPKKAKKRQKRREKQKKRRNYNTRRCWSEGSRGSITSSFRKPFLNHLTRSSKSILTPWTPRSNAPVATPRPWTSCTWKATTSSAPLTDPQRGQCVQRGAGILQTRSPTTTSWRKNIRSGCPRGGPTE